MKAKKFLKCVFNFKCFWRSTSPRSSSKICNRKVIVLVVKNIKMHWNTLSRMEGPCWCIFGIQTKYGVSLCKTLLRSQYPSLPWLECEKPDYSVCHVVCSFIGVIVEKHYQIYLAVQRLSPPKACICLYNNLRTYCTFETVPPICWATAGSSVVTFHTWNLCSECFFNWYSSTFFIGDSASSFCMVYQWCSLWYFSVFYLNLFAKRMQSQFDVVVAELLLLLLNQRRKHPDRAVMKVVFYCKMILCSCQTV